MTTMLKSEIFHNIQNSISIADTPALLSHHPIASELVSYVASHVGESVSPDLLILLHRFATLALQFPTSQHANLSLNVIINNAIIIATESSYSLPSLVLWLANQPSRHQYIDQAIADDDGFTNAYQLLLLSYSLWAEQCLQYTKEFILSKAVYV